MEDTAEAEAKLLEILKQEDPAETSDEESELTEEQRATLSKILASQMMTPEEIAKAAAINEHNAAVALRRQENLIRRRQRSLSRVKKRKRK